MIFKFIVFEEHQITMEIEANSLEEAKEKIDNGEGKEIDRKSEWEVQEY